MMKFPAYVPAAVRKFFEDWNELLTATSQISSSYRGKKEVAAKIKILHNLTHCVAMQEAYEMLASKFTAGAQWEDFFEAALAANLDGLTFRERIKREQVRAKRIACAAEKLAALLRETSFGEPLPGHEFRSIPGLLRESAGRCPNDWAANKGKVFGDDPTVSLIDISNDGEPLGASVVLQIHEAQAQERKAYPDRWVQREAIRQAWDAAPDLPALLDALGSKARELTPEYGGAVGAAIATRQQNPKTEYLRAFAYALTKHQDIELTPKIMQAMAIVATVVFNDPDIVVTYDDVRQALKPKPG